MKLILQTRRLTLRELEKEDVGALRLILQDPLVMYAWEHAFTDAEIRGWIETNQARYQKDGCGYWAAQASETGKLIGMLGLLMEELDGERKLGLGYLLRRDCWGMGYATEGAQALLDEAFYKRNALEVIAEIRPENIPSRRVAERLGMRAEGELVKRYRGKELMSQDELAVMDGGKCILQLRGVRPFLSDKYDITKHPNFQYTADADDKNAFDIEAFLSARLKLKPNEVCDVYEVDTKGA